MSVIMSPETILFADGVVSQVTLTNTDGTSKIVRIWAACIDLLDPASSENPQGKTLVGNRWLQGRVDAGSWVEIGFPAVFPDSFVDLAEGCLQIALAANSAKTIDLKVVIPANPGNNSGNLNWVLVWRYIDG